MRKGLDRAGPIGLCLAEGEVVAVQCASGSPLGLRATARVALPGNMDGEEVRRATVQGAIREALEAAPFRGRSVHLAVPAGECFIHHLRIPPVPPEEVPDSVRWEMEEACPWPADQTQFRFRIVGEVRERGEVRLEVQVLAVRREEALRLTGTCGAGLVVEALEAAPWALLRSAALLAGEGAAPVEVLCTGGGPSLAAVLWNGAPACIRPLTAGDADPETELATCTAYVSPLTGGQRAAQRLTLGAGPEAADPFARLVRRAPAPEDRPFYEGAPDLDALVALGLALGERGDAPWRS
ncbi:MAG: hypothetical protein HY722_01950 [Planctomycetes bacterium]|nr:hypothetical protein [Planctomycetota bacterium]